MNEKELKNWSEIRKKGQNKFILKHGVLIYGLFLAFCFVGGKILYHFIADNFDFSYINMKFIGENTFLFVFFLFFGVVLAWQVWRRKEREFLER